MADVHKSLLFQKIEELEKDLQKKINTIASLRRQMIEYEERE